MTPDAKEIYLSINGISPNNFNLSSASAPDLPQGFYRCFVPHTADVVFDSIVENGTDVTTSFDGFPLPVGVPVFGFFTEASISAGSVRFYGFNPTAIQ